MFGLLARRRLKVTSSYALSTEDVVRDGVRGHPDVNAIATRQDKEVEILLWNYHDDDLPADASPIELTIAGLSSTVSRGLVEHFRVDTDLGNSFAAWNQMGSPQAPSAEQFEKLQSAGQLQLLAPPTWIAIDKGQTHLTFVLPRQAVSLVRMRWP